MKESEYKRWFIQAKYDLEDAKRTISMAEKY